MKKLSHDKNLDSDSKLKKQSEFYDRVDLSERFDVKNASFVHAKTKRINMVIPLGIYNDAKWIGDKAGTGYQNALKMAMIIGLKNLSENVSELKSKQQKSA